MPVLRLFGPARECAGTGSVEVTDGSVAQILDEATGRFGPTFAEIVTTSRLWVNGQAADRERVLTDLDELAVLPPVSGG